MERKNTSSIDDIIRQISSLFVFNTSMMFAAGVLYFYMLHNRFSTGNIPEWSYWSDLSMFIAVSLKIWIHVPSIAKKLHAQHQELLTASINTLLHIGAVLALMTLPHVGSVVSFILSFQPALLLIAMVPLIRKNRTMFYQEFWGFLQYCVVILTLIWFFNSCVIHYEQKNIFGIAANLLVLLAPKTIDWIRKHHTRNISERLHKEIYSDPLTGLENRKSFYEYYDVLRHNAHSALPALNGKDRFEKYGLALFYIDVDHFKIYNDSYGHNQGDSCLVEVARFLEEFSSSLGMNAYRLGGEEFVVCGSMTEEQFVQMIESPILQQWINGKMQLDISFPDTPLSRGTDIDSVTISGGLTFTPKELFYTLNAGKITNSADALLYESKKKGRNTLSFSVVGGDDIAFTKKE